MRIDLPPAAQPLARPAARRPLRATAFAIPADDDAPAAEAAAPAYAAAPPSPATTEAASPGPRHATEKAATSHGQAMLGALAGLQAAALAQTPGQGGEEPALQARQTLADLARALPATANPGLNGVLLAIAQRAAIELARS